MHSEASDELKNKIQRLEKTLKEKDEALDEETKIKEKSLAKIKQLQAELGKPTKGAYFIFNFTFRFKYFQQFFKLHELF